MFVRPRKSMSKVRLSLVETRRVGGKVKHEHVASLGSLPQAMTVVIGGSSGVGWSRGYRRWATGSTSRRRGP
jgi:hypothetical protein